MTNITKKHQIAAIFIFFALSQSFEGNFLRACTLAPKTYIYIIISII